MKQETEEWDFKGGFNKKTSAIICKELNLKNKIQFYDNFTVKRSLDNLVLCLDIRLILK